MDQDIHRSHTVGIRGRKTPNVLHTGRLKRRFLDDAENRVTAIQAATLITILVGRCMSALALAVRDGYNRLPDAGFIGSRVAFVVEQHRKACGSRLS